MIIKIEHDISKKNISNLLCSAMEGGSNYWYMIDKYIKPKKIDFDSFKGDYALAGPDVYKHLHYPLSEGGGIVFEIEDGVKFKTRTLNLSSIKDGLEIMSQKYPRHFSDFLTDSGDAITGDVFLQCCLFGELVYG